jgi:Novel toxin 16
MAGRTGRTRKIDESAADIAKHFNQAETTAQQVCAAPALGPAHPAAKKAKVKMFGDCTKAEFIPLRQAVVGYCKKDLTRCEERDSCSVLRDKRDQFVNCRDARTVLRDRCYSNRRDTHDRAINDLNEGRLRCVEFMASKGC